MEKNKIISSEETYSSIKKFNSDLNQFKYYSLLSNLFIGKNVLELGSSRGEGASFLANFANHIFGIEDTEIFSADSNKLYNQENLKFLDKSNFSLVENKSIDFVFSILGIKSYNFDEQTFVEIKRILKPTGALIILHSLSESDLISNYNLINLKLEIIQELISAESNYFKHNKKVSLNLYINQFASKDENLVEKEICNIWTFSNPPLQDSYGDCFDFHVQKIEGDHESMNQNNFYSQKLSELQRKVDELSSALNSQIKINQLKLDEDMQNSFQSNLGFRRIIKFIYNIIPFGSDTKRKHREFISKFAPWILKPQLKLVNLSNEYECLVYATRIHIPTSKNPLVSIVIPVYGQIKYTLECLNSIASNIPNTNFEIIVVDDCSPDNSINILQKVDGIKLILNSTNLGFIRSCNLGAKAAKGEYICFLNNDTQVKYGWLDELIATFRVLPETGFVGSKLLNADNTLQEAGGIIWQDGSAWNFGRNQNPDLPEFNYAREVDYCSGASIMVPKKIFESIGGFDEHYLPAYCEDSDFALKVRSLGYRVIYQPLSVVIHYEGITSGKDVKSGVKSYQINNTIKLFKRWESRLANYQKNGTNINKAKDRASIQRVLVIDSCTPTPNKDAGSVTTFNLMVLLREMKFQVTFIPADNLIYLQSYTADLQRIGIEALYRPYISSIDEHLAESGDRYDLVFIFRPEVFSNNIKSIREKCVNAKILYHTIDLHFLRMEREAQLLNDKIKKINAAKMKQIELAAIIQADSSIVHSTRELELLKEEIPNANIFVSPLIINIPGTKSEFDLRKDIVFIGGYQHIPNVDAVEYFVEKIMPHIRISIPGIKFHIVGSHPPEQVLKLAANDIIIHGFVDDIEPLLNKMKISVAPLRYGAGIKGKIGTTMAYGLPTIATSIAAEGMGLTNKQNILIEDNPEVFANEIAKLYVDRDSWNKLSSESINFAEFKWGAKTSWNILENILENLGLAVESEFPGVKLYSANYQKEFFEDSKKINDIKVGENRKGLIQ